MPMHSLLTRRSAVRTLAGGAAYLAALRLLQAQVSGTYPDAMRHGRIQHSVCKWCYPKIPIEDLCRAACEIGISSIELVGPDDWPTLRKHGLTCAMANGADLGVKVGWNRPEHHDELVARYTRVIPLAAATGLTQIICLSGLRQGMSDEEGLEHCADGLRRILPVAEKHGVTICLEMLNSKVNHKDNMADSTAWAVELVNRLASERFKLLYDIYHMQIMEGNVIATIRAHHRCFAHYHTGGVPGRNEIDDTQELNYPAIMRAIVATGYKGHVGQEFRPSRPDPLASLRQAVDICDV